MRPLHGANSGTCRGVHTAGRISRVSSQKSHATRERINTDPWTHPRWLAERAEPVCNEAFAAAGLFFSEALLTLPLQRPRFSTSPVVGCLQGRAETEPLTIRLRPGRPFLLRGAANSPAPTPEVLDVTGCRLLAGSCRNGAAYNTPAPQYDEPKRSPYSRHRSHGGPDQLAVKRCRGSILQAPSQALAWDMYHAQRLDASFKALYNKGRQSQESSRLIVT